MLIFLGSTITALVAFSRSTSGIKDVGVSCQKGIHGRLCVRHNAGIVAVIAVTAAALLFLLTTASSPMSLQDFTGAIRIGFLRGRLPRLRRVECQQVIARNIIDIIVVAIITNNGSIYLLHLRCVALRSSTQLRIQSVNYDRMIIIKIALVQFVVI